MTTSPARERGCALVTGASRGIGAAIARGLAQDGWAVGVNYRESREAAEAVVAEIRSSGGEAVMARADVSNADEVDELVPALEREFGRPALVLINNAAMMADAPLLRLDDEALRAVLETNLTASIRLTRQVLRPMLRERYGRIVNMVSVAALRASPGQTAYAASKAGMIGFTKAAAAEVARRGVTVNAIAPGLIETDSSAHAVEGLLPRVPAGRVGTPQEVAACARFLASEDAGYVTGSVLTVDGGLAA